MKIGIYFGSFNPVHNGHMEIAKAPIKEKLVDRVLIVPTESYWDKQDLLPLFNRINMLRMAIADLDLPEDKKPEIDVVNNQYWKTYELMRSLKSQYPDDELCIIMGSDSLIRFEEWYKFEELLAYTFIIAERDTFPKDSIDEFMAEYKKEDYHILNIVPMQISSTFIRSCKDYSLVKDMINKRVFDYYMEVR